MQASIVRRTASAPALWPSGTGRPRASAQRRLPSMMMATCPGGADWPERRVVATGAASSGASSLEKPDTSSDLPDVLLLVAQDLVDLLDVLIRELLHLVGPVLGVVLADRGLLVLLLRLHLLHAI